MSQNLRAPIEAPWELDPITGQLTSPAWLAYFNRGITPAVNDLASSADSPDIPINLGKDYAPQQSGSQLEVSGQRERRVYPPDGFPPAPMQGHASDSELSMLADIQAGRQQAIWVAADTLANQTKYPPGSFPLDSLFVATDKKLLYYNTGAAWVLVPNVPTSATVLASNAGDQIIAAPLADTKIWIGQGSGLPAAESVSGDATLADTGALTLATVNPDVGTYGDATDVAQVTVNAKGLVTAAASVPITFPPGPAGFPGFTGTLAAAIAAGKNVSNGVIQP